MLLIKVHTFDDFRQPNRLQRHLLSYPTGVSSVKDVMIGSQRKCVGSLQGEESKRYPFN